MNNILLGASLIILLFPPEYLYSQEQSVSVPVQADSIQTQTPHKPARLDGNFNSAFPVFELDTLPADKSLSLRRRPMAYRIDSETEYLYYKPRPLEFLTDVPATMLSAIRGTFRKENLPIMGVILASTAILVVYDQKLLDGTQKFGRSIGLPGTNRMKAYFSIAGQPIEGPQDTDTALYFLGDGWTHTAIAIGFLGSGLIKDDNRALQTASQLFQGMITVGFTTQFLKHITGRQSPFVSSAPGGLWRLFPNQIEYHKHVPEYDAYPSGHLATAMMTVTVIAENYPEKKWIRPMGYFLMSLLSFEMMNNGVHWVSDYPLALAIGYGFGKLISTKYRWIKRIPPDLSAKRGLPNSLTFYPTFAGGGGVLVGVFYRF